MRESLKCIPVLSQNKQQSLIEAHNNKNKNNNNYYYYNNDLEDTIRFYYLAIGSGTIKIEGSRDRTTFADLPLKLFPPKNKLGSEEQSLDEK